MNTFPKLASNAVTQYPAVLQSSHAVQVLEFLDSSDQRFLLQPKSLRLWRVNLNQLNDAEILAIENFFSNQQGEYSTFIFADPFSGTDVVNCRFATPDLISTYSDVNNTSTSCWVMETNG
jgi:hypothetical protein